MIGSWNGTAREYLVWHIKHSTCMYKSEPGYHTQKMEVATDPILFCTESGEALKFYMRPSNMKARLKPLIEARGGIVSSKISPSRNWIKLAAKDDFTRSDDYISIKYIDDCIAQETLLPMKGYRLKAQPRPPSSPVNSTVSHNTSIQGRMRYNSDEDDAILSYLKKHPQKSYSGCKFWKKMELLKITSHSWQSMKDRFLKKLLNVLPTYTEQENQATKTKEKKSSDDSKETTPTSDESVSDFDAHLLEEAEKQTSKEVKDDSTHEEMSSNSEEQVIPAKRNRLNRSLRRRHDSESPSREPSPSPELVEENGIPDNNELESDMDTSSDSDSEADRVVAFVEKVREKHKVSAKMVVHLLYFHSGDFNAVLEHLKTGAPKEDMISWTPGDDKKLGSSNPGDINELCQTYGQNAVEKRQAFFI